MALSPEHTQEAAEPTQQLANPLAAEVPKLITSPIFLLSTAASGADPCGVGWIRDVERVVGCVMPMGPYYN